MLQSIMYFIISLMKSSKVSIALWYLCLIWNYTTGSSLDRSFVGSWEDLFNRESNETITGIIVPRSIHCLFQTINLRITSTIFQTANFANSKQYGKHMWSKRYYL